LGRRHILVIHPRATCMRLRCRPRATGLDSESRSDPPASTPQPVRPQTQMVGAEYKTGGSSDIYKIRTNACATRRVLLATDASTSMLPLLWVTKRLTKTLERMRRIKGVPQN
jgi:hypothetical protein